MDTEQQKTFDFWQDHSKNYLEMALRTDRRGRIAKPDGYGRRTGDCGDTVEIFLEVQEDCIRSVSYMADGCINTHACANTVAELIEGRTVDQAWQVTPETVVDYLETLPQAEIHCAELAVGALYLALADCRDHQRNPWKKAYRKES